MGDMEKGQSCSRIHEDEILDWIVIGDRIVSDVNSESYILS